MQDFRNLSVWQASRQLATTVYQLTANLPIEERFGLQAQMGRASISICSNIAEGCGRRGDREFRRFLDVAMGSGCELECELLLSVDLAFITERQQSAAHERIIAVKRMLGGLLRQLSPMPSKDRAEVAADSRELMRRADSRELMAES
jgi:four helix bundle protein